MERTNKISYTEASFVARFPVIYWVTVSRSQSIACQGYTQAIDVLVAWVYNAG